MPPLAALVDHGLQAVGAVFMAAWIETRPLDATRRLFLQATILGCGVGLAPLLARGTPSEVCGLNGLLLVATLLGGLRGAVALGPALAGHVLFGTLPPTAVALQLSLAIIGWLAHQYHPLEELTWPRQFALSALAGLLVVGWATLSRGLPGIGGLVEAAVAAGVVVLAIQALTPPRYLRRALKHLRRQAHRLRSVARAMPDLMLLGDEDGNFEQLIADDEMPGTRDALALAALQAALLQHHQARLRTINRAALTEGRSRSYAFEVIVQGRVRHLDARVSPVEAAFGDPGPRVLWLIRDVSERRELEGQLRNSQKFEALGRLAGGIAHDFNNVLTIILGNAGELARRKDLDAEARQAVEESAEAARRAAKLTEQLLSFSRKRAMKREILAVGAAVHRFEPLLRRLIREDIDLQVQVRSPQANIEVDAAQLEQLVLNLAVNARDAMPQGGNMTIAVDVVTLPAGDGRLRDGMQPGPYVCISAIDDGVGMDDQTRAHIFEPFFTTKRTGHGTGLGLATVHAIVAQHRGTIDVTSSPGEGTRFDVYFRSLRGRPRSMTPAIRTATPIPLERRTLLVVEDEPAVLRVMKRTLTRAGHEVLTARNGREAIEQHEARLGEIALLVTDVIMPGMSGRELAEIFLERAPGVPILFVSGHTDDAELLNRFEGSVYILNKPFADEALRGEVERILQTHRASGIDGLGAAPEGPVAAGL